MVKVVYELVEQQPVICVLYLLQTDLGWNKLTYVETNWPNLEMNYSNLRIKMTCNRYMQYFWANKEKKDLTESWAWTGCFDLSG